MSRQWPDRLAASLGTPVPLQHDLGFVPLAVETPDLVKDPVLGFLDLTDSVARLAAEASAGTQVAYIHAETFAGSGFHAAVAWVDGEIAFGPVFTTNNEADKPEDFYEFVSDGRDMAVNQVLRFLGVAAEDDGDEFSAVGLDSRRFTSEWL